MGDLAFESIGDKQRKQKFLVYLENRKQYIQTWEWEDKME